jgi:hypothetical protein
MTPARWWSVFAAVAVVALALLVKVLIADQPPTSLLVALGATVLLLVLCLQLDRLVSIVAGTSGLTVNLAQLATKEDVNKLGQDVADLLISTVLDAFEYITLQKVRGDRKDSYKFTPKGQDLLERLANRGLIEEKQTSNVFADRTIRDLRLMEHYVITDRGNQYLEVIHKLDVGKALERVALRAGYVNS